MSTTTQDVSTISASDGTIVQTSVDSSAADSVTIMPAKAEMKVNPNKPWRIVIKRSVMNVGSDNENISGDIIDN